VFRCPPFAFQATEGRQVSVQPPVKKTAGQIEKETLKKRIMNIEQGILSLLFLKKD
jgi:hypothetical protein